MSDEHSIIDRTEIELVIADLVRLEGCSVATAWQAMRRSDWDPIKARDLIKIVQAAHRLADPGLDQDAAKLAIAAADAELGSWGPHQPPLDLIVIGSVWREIATGTQVVVMAIGEVITYKHLSFVGSTHTSRWHANYVLLCPELAPLHTVELRIQGGGPVLCTWNRHEVIRKFDVQNPGLTSMWWELVRVPSCQVIFSGAAHPGWNFSWQSASPGEDIIA